MTYRICVYTCWTSITHDIPSHLYESLSTLSLVSVIITITFMVAMIITTTKMGITTTNDNNDDNNDMGIYTTNICLLLFPNPSPISTLGVKSPHLQF